jgi:hypothetical protein
MSIIRQNFKKVKAKKPNAKQRELDADWQRMIASHSKPLERGASVRGNLPDVKVKKRKKYKEPVTDFDPTPAPVVRVLPPPSNPWASASKPQDDATLRAAKDGLKHRIGQSFNKGGLQYLTDDELAEQVAGAHKRR